MFTTKQLENYASIMVWAMKKARINPFKSGDLVRLTRASDLLSQDLAERIYKRLIGNGLNVYPVVEKTDTMVQDFFEYASEEQLSYRLPWLEAMAETLNGSIYLWAPNDIYYLSHVDPDRQVLPAKAYKVFRDIINRREEIGDFGWTLCAIPTMTGATAAGLSLKDYTYEIANACFLDSGNTVQEWEKIVEESKRIKEKLNSMRITKVYVTSQNIDLKVFVGDARQWLGASGHNIPSFETFTSPHYRYTEGKFFADLPSFRGGNVIKDVKLHFQNGKVVDHSAGMGYDYLTSQLNTDEHARVVGEFSLTDKRFSNINKFMANTLYDENYGGKHGNCHIAIGRSYLDTFTLDPSKLTDELRDELGFSDSAIHWDLINTEDKIVEVEQSGLKGRTIIYKDGQFVI